MQQMEGTLTMQQYTLPDAVNATRGFGETICVFRFRFAAKPAITVSVSVRLVSMCQAMKQPTQCQFRRGPSIRYQPPFDEVD
tara:strand:- start:76 stop:321 length:246 start_codon:yes stop_codon:yes gene_type:complete